MRAVGKKNKILVISAMLVAVAATLSVLEGMLPLQAVVPLPGLKIGLANIVTMFAIFFLGYRYTFPIVVARCLLGSLFAGGPISLLFSLSGALMAAVIMLLLKKGYGKHLSFYGISLAGSAAFNIMQVAAAAVILQDVAIFSYLPVLMIGGVATGILTAAVFSVFYKSIEKSGIAKRYLEN